MSVLIAIPILGAMLILQTAVFSKMTLLHGTTDLVMLTVIAWALQKRAQTAWQWGIIGGLFVSFVTGLPFFVPLISYLAAVGLALILRQRVWNIPILAMFIVTFVGTFLTQAFSVIALRITGVTIPVIQGLNTITLPSLILNLLVALPIYALIGELANILYPEELEV